MTSFFCFALKTTHFREWLYFILSESLSFSVNLCVTTTHKKNTHFRESFLLRT